jgi:hypothetical protein
MNGVVKMTYSQIALRLVLTALIVMSAGMSPAQTSPSTDIADGKPWNAIGPGGRAMTLTFYGDGTVKAAMGFMGMSMTWIPTDDGICMSGGPQGDKCVTLVKTETGYQGIENGQVTLQLNR